MSESSGLHSVMVTGSTGFVGRQVVRELLARGLKPICVVRSPRQLYAQHPEVDPARLAPIIGSLSDTRVLQEAADLSQAVIHLAGIIIERRLRGKTFKRVHVKGTRNVLEATKRAGIKRFIQMSALGTRADAQTAYHRTKWRAEEFVRQSGTDWTIFRPSLIHGPEGEFMRLMKCFACNLIPPVMPYFGTGQFKLQPISVKDVAYCLVESLNREQTIRKTYPLGGPKALSWVELYNICRVLIPGAKPWKPLVSLPVPVAKVLATLLGPPMATAELIVPSLGLLRFDRGQVQMAQEDSICDHTVAEQAFAIQMRDFQLQLSLYADQIK